MRACSLKYVFLFFVITCFYANANEKANSNTYIGLFKSDWGPVNDSLSCKVTKGEIVFDKKENKFSIEVILLIKNTSSESKRLVIGPYEVPTLNGPNLYIIPCIWILKKINEDWVIVSRLADYTGDKIISIPGNTIIEKTFISQDESMNPQSSSSEFKVEINIQLGLKDTDFRGKLESGTFQLSESTTMWIKQIVQKTLKEEELREKLDNLTNKIRSNPQNADNYYQRSRVYSEMTQHEKASKDLSKFEELRREENSIALYPPILDVKFETKNSNNPDPIKKYEVSVEREDIFNEQTKKLKAVFTHFFRNKIKIMDRQICDTDDDGEFDLEVCQFFSNGSLVIQVTYDKRRTTGAKIIVRNFPVPDISSKTIDVTGNGLMDKILLTDNCKFVDLFLRDRKTNVITPVSANAYDKYKTGVISLL